MVWQKSSEGWGGGVQRAFVFAIDGNEIMLTKYIFFVFSKFVKAALNFNSHDTAGFKKRAAFRLKLLVYNILTPCHFQKTHADL